MVPAHKSAVVYIVRGAYCEGRGVTQFKPGILPYYWATSMVHGDGTAESGESFVQLRLVVVMMIKNDDNDKRPLKSIRREREAAVEEHVFYICCPANLPVLAAAGWLPAVPSWSRVWLRCTACLHSRRPAVLPIWPWWSSWQRRRLPCRSGTNT